MMMRPGCSIRVSTSRGITRLILASAGLRLACVAHDTMGDGRVDLTLVDDDSGVVSQVAPTSVLKADGARRIQDLLRGGFVSAHLIRLLHGENVVMDNCFWGEVVVLGHFAEGACETERNLSVDRVRAAQTQLGHPARANFVFDSTLTFKGGSSVVCSRHVIAEAGRTACRARLHRRGLVILGAPWRHDRGFHNGTDIAASVSGTARRTHTRLVTSLRRKSPVDDLMIDQVVQVIELNIPPPCQSPFNHPILLKAFALTVRLAGSWLPLLNSLWITCRISCSFSWPCTAHTHQKHQSITQSQVGFDPLLP